MLTLVRDHRSPTTTPAMTPALRGRSVSAINPQPALLVPTTVFPYSVWLLRPTYRDLDPRVSQLREIRVTTTEEHQGAAVVADVHPPYPPDDDVVVAAVVYGLEVAVDPREDVVDARRS